MTRGNYTPAKYHSPRETSGDMGPAMKELNERERAIVYYLLDHPAPVGQENFSAACRAAGYSTASDDALRVTASRKRRDPRIAAALVEEGKRELNMALPGALATLTSIAADRSHKDATKAALAVLGMSGISPVALSKTETNVNVNVNLHDDVAAAAAILGVDPDQLLRGRIIDVTPEPAPPPAIPHYEDEDEEPEPLTPDEILKEMEGLW